MSKKLLLVSDFAIHSGFALVGESVAVRLHRDHGWDITVLAINWLVDPHPLQKFFTIYPPFTDPRTRTLSPDIYGTHRFTPLMQQVDPDAVLIIQDPWIIKRYFRQFYVDDTSYTGRMVCYVPVDGVNQARDDVLPLNHATEVVAYTAFGKRELQKAGLTTACSIIPHGVDLDQFYPVPRTDARKTFGFDEDWFIVLVLDRNQPRKRIDLAMMSFAKWMKTKPERERERLKFWYHGAIRDVGVDVVQFAEYLDMKDNLIIDDRLTPLHGAVPEMLKFIYACADVKLSTSSGEGWGLTHMEAQACGTPTICVRYAALAEWSEGATRYVEPSEMGTRMGSLNVLGATPRKVDVVDAIETLYASEAERNRLALAGQVLVQEPRFRWENVATQFDEVLSREAALPEKIPEGA